MNDYTETRLRRVRNILARHVFALDSIMNGEATNLEAGQELSLLLNNMETGSNFKQDCKELEAEAYRLADKEGLIHE